MTQAAHDLGTENLLVVPGAVYIPWLKDTNRCPTTSATAGPAKPSAS